MKRFFSWKWLRGALLTLALVVVGGAGIALAADDVPRMTVAELSAMLDSPDVEIIDVRAEWDWKKTEGMIKNATRQSPNKVGAWMNGLDKSKTIVLYCA